MGLIAGRGVKLQEWKLRRTQGLMEPPWTEEEEEHFVKHVADIEQKGLCFVTVKHGSQFTTGD